MVCVFLLLLMKWCLDMMLLWLLQWADEVFAVDTFWVDVILAVVVVAEVVGGWELGFGG